MATITGRRLALHRTALVFAVLAVWETVTRVGWADPDFFSPPTAIVQAFARLATPTMLQAAGLTGYQILLGFLLSAAVGIVLGLALGLSATVRRIADPILMLLFGLPKVATLPLFMLFLGIGPSSKIGFSMALGLFPILLNVITGVATVDGPIITAARSMGAGPWQIFAKVVLPGALPSIITGLRLGLSQVVLGVMLAELFSSSTGLGYWVRQFTATFKPAELFAVFFAVAAFAILGNELMRWLERRAGRWAGDDIGVM